MQDMPAGKATTVEWKHDMARAILDAQGGSVLALSFSVGAELRGLAKRLEDVGVALPLDADIYPESDSKSVFRAKLRVLNSPQYLRQMCDTLRTRREPQGYHERVVRQVMDKIEEDQDVTALDMRRFCIGCEDLAQRMLKDSIPEMASVVLSMGEDVVLLAEQKNPGLKQEMRASNCLSSRSGGEIYPRLRARDEKEAVGFAASRLAS
jgi:hypothetical protein